MADYSSMFDQQFGQQGGTQLYRNQKYVQVGGNIMRTPTSISLSEMYGVPKAAANAQVAAAQVPMISPPTPETPISTSGYDVNEFLANSPNWQQVTLSTGTKAWMPAKAEPGDFYLGPDDQLYEYKDGTWAATENVTSVSKLKGQIGKSAYHCIEWDAYLKTTRGKYAFADSIVNNYLNNNIDATTALAQLENTKVQRRDQLQAHIDELRSRAYGTAEDRITELQRELDATTKDIDKIKEAVQGKSDAVNEMLRFGKITGIDVDPTKLGDANYAHDVQNQMADLAMQTAGVGVNVNLTDLPGMKDFLTVDFGQQAKELINQLDKGTLDIFTEMGTINYDTLKEQGAVGEWLSNVFQEATATGVLQEDYIQGVDEEGNIKFSSEIENLIGEYDDTIAEQQELMMKDLKLTAALQGRSLEDVAFTGTMLAWVDNATRQAATQLAETLKQDLSAGYESMGNSIVNMIRQMTDDATAQSFAEILEQKKETALADYNAQMEAIAEETAQRKGAGILQIIQGVISAAATAALILL